jgi:L-fucose mutarotase
MLTSCFSPTHISPARPSAAAIPPLIDAILTLVELDRHSPALSMMAPSEGDHLDPALEADYLKAVQLHAPDIARPVLLERAVFYERSKAAFAVVVTGDVRPYGNILLRKGITPPMPPKIPRN